MKIAALFLALLPLSAFAVDQAPPLKEAQPIRQMHVHGKIEKTFITNGQFNLGVPEKVCEFDGEIPLFDVMKPDETQALKNVIVCDSVIDGKPVKVQVSSNASLVSDVRGGPATEKMGSLLVLAYYKGQRKVYSGQSGRTGSRDLDTRSMTLFMSSPSFNTREKLTVYQATANFEDAP